MSWHPLLLSLKVTSAATLLIFAIGLILAIFFARHQFRGQTILETAIHLPLVLPPSVVGYYLLILLGKDGPIAHWFGWNLLFTWPAAVIASTVVGLPLMFQAARSAIANVDPDLEHAARTLGSSELEVIWRITLPLSRRGILAGLVLGSTRALGEFAANIPGKTQTLPLAIYDAVQNSQYGLAHQMVLLMTVLGFMSLWCVRRLEPFRRAEVAVPAAEERTHA